MRADLVATLMLSFTAMLASCSGDEPALDRPNGPGAGGSQGGGAAGSDDDAAVGPDSDGGDASEDASEEPTPPPKGQVGAVCASGDDCESGICLDIGRCTAPCDDATDCPVSTNWQCGLLPGTGKICQCQPTGASETCDGIDDDCNALIDDGDPCSEPGQVCEYAACVCPPENDCYGECVDIGSDPENCGACYRSCPGTCTAGECDCPPGQTPCEFSAGSVSCVDLQTNKDACGACGHACGPLEACESGVCTCYGVNGMQCAGECRDVDVAPLNCGACGNACPAGPGGAAAMCAGGSCTYAEIVSSTFGMNGYSGDIAIDGNTVFIGETTDLYTVDKTTGTTLQTSLPQGTGCSAPSAPAIGLDASYIYRMYRCYEGPYRVIRFARANLFDQPPPAGWTTVLDTGPAAVVAGLTCSATHVYYSVQPNGGGPFEIRSIPKAGGGVPTVIYQSAVPLRSLAADATSLYMLEVDDSSGPVRILSVPLAGGTEHVIATDQQWYVSAVFDGSLKVAGGDVYYGAGWITRKVPIAGGAPTTVIGDAAVTIAVGVDNSHVYWVAQAQTGWDHWLKRTPR